MRNGCINAGLNIVTTSKQFNGGYSAQLLEHWEYGYIFQLRTYDDRVVELPVEEVQSMTVQTYIVGTSNDIEVFNPETKWPFIYESIIGQFKDYKYHYVHKSRTKSIEIFEAALKHCGVSEYTVESRKSGCYTGGTWEELWYSL